MQKNKITLISLIILLIIGIALFFTIGFNVGIDYKETTVIEVNLGKRFEDSDIVKIAKDTFKMEVKVNKVEIYEELFKLNINDGEISEEKLEEFIVKINEKFETKILKENVNKYIEENINLKDLIKPYVFPIILTIILLLVYYIIIGIFSRLGKNNIYLSIETITLNILLFINFFTIYLIFRIPVNREMFSYMLVYFVTTILLTSYLHFSKVKNKSKK